MNFASRLPTSAEGWSRSRAEPSAAPAVGPAALGAGNRSRTDAGPAPDRTRRAYVAMVRDRPYRKAIPAEAAFAELERHSGSQFDSSVVTVLVGLERGRASATVAEADRVSPPAEDDSSLAA